MFSYIRNHPIVSALFFFFCLAWISVQCKFAARFSSPPDFELTCRELLQIPVCEFNDLPYPDSFKALMVLKGSPTAAASSSAAVCVTRDDDDELEFAAPGASLVVALTAVVVVALLAALMLVRNVKVVAEKVSEKCSVPNISDIDLVTSYAVVYVRGQRDPIHVPLGDLLGLGTVHDAKQPSPFTPQLPPSPAPSSPPPSFSSSPDYILPLFYTPQPVIKPCLDTRFIWTEPPLGAVAEAIRADVAPLTEANIARLGSPFTLPAAAPPTPPSPIFKRIPYIRELEGILPKAHSKLTERELAQFVVSILNECFTYHRKYERDMNEHRANWDLPPVEVPDIFDAPNLLLPLKNQLEGNQPMHPIDLLRVLYTHLQKLEFYKRYYRVPNTWREISWKDIMGSQASASATPEYARLPIFED